MTSTNREILEDKAQNAALSDKLVLALVSRRPSRATAIQKIGLLVNSVLSGTVPAGFEPHFFGGFNETIDASVEELQEEGFLWQDDAGAYSLTPSGKSLLEDYLTDRESTKVKELTEQIAGRMANLSDREIIAIAYEMFPELTGKSLIKEKVAQTRRFKNAQLTTLPR